MRAYSDDLRERVAAAYATGQFTIGQVASRFSVSTSFVEKLLKRQRASGSVAALPHRGGPAPRLQEADRQRLAACMAPQPDATLAELGQQLMAAGSPAVGQTVLWQTLQALDLRRKIKSLHAAERDTERVRRLRQDFLEAIQQEDSTRFKFVDETSVNLTYTRRYGRAPGGRRVDAAVPLHNGPNVTVIAALSAQGVEAVMELDGAVNTASFTVYLEQVLGPGLQPGDVVVLDNLRVHKAAGLAELVRSARGTTAVSATVLARFYAH